MFCGNCGNQIPEGENVCPFCGGSDKAVSDTGENGSTAYYAQKRPGAPMDYASVSVVLGIMGLVFCWGCPGLIINILGIIFGAKAYGRSQRKAGLVMSIIGLILTLILTFALVGWISYLGISWGGYRYRYW